MFSFQLLKMLLHPPSAKNTLNFLLKQMLAVDKAYIWKCITEYNPISSQKQNIGAGLIDAVNFNETCTKLNTIK